MLTVILSVLRIIGLVLLILLGIILFLLGLVLFMPVVYRVKAQKQDKAEAEVRIRWLFGFLRAGICYPNPGSFIVKVLFFTVYDSGKEEVSASEDNAEEEPLSEEETELLFDSIETGSEGNGTVSAEPQNSMDSFEKDEKASEEKAKAWRDAETKSQGEKTESKFDKIKYTFRNTCDKIKDTWENISYYKDILDDNETRSLLDHVLIRLGRIIKSIRPRKLEADLLFGTGSPDTTGYLLGVYGMFSPVLGNHFVVTPDFESSVLKGNFYAGGHITLAGILWQGILLVLDKKLWRFISKVKKEKKNGR